MPSKTVSIKKITRGNDLTLKFNVTTTVDLNAARFIAKKKTKDADGAAIVNKPVTTAATANGQISDIGGSDDLAVVLIFLTQADTMQFKAAVEYVWDLEVFDAAGKATTPVGGNITFDERVRIATG